jgi:hypothetical protein
VREALRLTAVGNLTVTVVRSAVLGRREVMETAATMPLFPAVSTMKPDPHVPVLSNSLT